jgi:hypothetical protein
MRLNKKDIPTIAIITQTVQYAMAGYFLIGWLGVVTVGLMGALVSIAMAFAASKYGESERRKTATVAALLTIMIFSPILVGTATWLHLTIIPNPIWRGVVSAVWGIIPDGAVVLAGFGAGKGLFEQIGKKKASKKKSSGGTGRQLSSGKSSVKATGKQTTRAEKMKEQIPCRWGCGLVGSKGQMNAHSAHCEKNPAKQFEQAAKVGKQ